MKIATFYNPNNATPGLAKAYISEKSPLVGVLGPSTVARTLKYAENCMAVHGHLK